VGADHFGLGRFPDAEAVVALPFDINGLRGGDPLTSAGRREGRGLFHRSQFYPAGGFRQRSGRLEPQIHTDRHGWGLPVGDIPNAHVLLGLLDAIYAPAEGS
jgi:hypothetical protein